MTAAADPVATFEGHRRALMRVRRGRAALFLALFAAMFLASARVGELYPASLLRGLPRVGEYFQRIAPTLDAAHLLDGVRTKGSLAYWFYRLGSWSAMLLDTAEMAFLATLMGGVAGFVLSFPASRNLMRSTVPYLACRRLAELFRTVPELVYALILVWAYGVGPLAGILAIFLHTTGALAKLFSEVNENIDPRPLEGIRAAGGNWAQMVAFGVVPQVLPNFLSYALLRFEINVRGAAVIGFVGAGGIGQELNQVISQNYYEEVSAIVVLIVAVVVAIDLGSEWLRHRYIAPRAAA